MKKRGGLCGFILLLVVSLAPTRVVASPGAFENSDSHLVAAWGQFLELVRFFVTGDTGSGIDPREGTATSGGTTNGGDLGPGIDPWG